MPRKSEEDKDLAGAGDYNDSSSDSSDEDSSSSDDFSSSDDDGSSSSDDEGVQNALAPKGKRRRRLGNEEASAGSIRRLAYGAGVGRMTSKLVTEVRVMVDVIVDRLLSKILTVTESRKKSRKNTMRIRFEDVRYVLPAHMARWHYLDKDFRPEMVKLKKVKALRSKAGKRIKRHSTKFRTYHKVKFYEKQVRHGNEYVRFLNPTVFRRKVTGPGKIPSQFSIQRGAISLMQSYVEFILIDICRAAVSIAAHDNRPTIQVRDFELARKLVAPDEEAAVAAEKKKRQRAN